MDDNNILAQININLQGAHKDIYVWWTDQQLQAFSFRGKPDHKS